jgi:ribokinase
MTIFNLGSVNIDHFYGVPHLPVPGETLSASSHKLGLGGKGVNQSVAAAKAGVSVYHIGAIGENEAWVRERILSYGIQCEHVHSLDCATGHAIIYVDAAGENSIVLEAGANRQLTEIMLQSAFDEAHAGDILLLQNETNQQVSAAKLALEKGMRVIYSAAPFDVDAVKAILPHVSMIAVNEVEAAQLSGALEVSLDQFRGPDLIVTLGSKGAMWRCGQSGETVEVSSPRVDAVDTTAAGDTFIGAVAAGLDAGLSIKFAMEWAVKAAALKVTREGTADAIPTRAEVDAYWSK